MHPASNLIALLLTLGALSALPATGAPFWNQFRGPNGSGVMESSHPPLAIDADRPAWTAPLPQGKSSPVRWGEALFLTGIEETRLVTLALDRRTGSLLWKRPAPETPLAYSHPAGSPAASTPCVDAAAVYVYFGSYGLLCYDHLGKEQWGKPLPTPKSLYGMSTSPILHEERIILLLDDDANLPDSELSRSRIIALHKATGEIVWETPRPFNRSGWSTPMIWTHEQGSDLVVLGNGRVYGYDPETGHEKWSVGGFSRETIAVPVAGSRRIYVAASMLGGHGDEHPDPEPFWRAILNFDTNGDQRVAREEISTHFTLPFRPELPPEHPGFGLPLPSDPDQRRERQNRIFTGKDANQDGFWTRDEFLAEMQFHPVKPNMAAIRPGGTGDVTASHVDWTLRRGIPEIPSPLFHKDRLYMVRDGGVLTCVNAGTGDVLYQERLGAPGQYIASPVGANDHLYVVSARGVVTVVRSGDTFRLVHQADLRSPVSATPAIDRDSLYIRTDERLIAFRSSDPDQDP